MEKEEFLTEFKKIVKDFQNRGCNEEIILSFIKNNLNFILENSNDLQNQIYFIYNKEELYGLLYVKENNYLWAIKKDGKILPFKSLKETSDYIVEMMIHFADAKKIVDVYPKVKLMNIENKIKTLRQIGLNNEGYHFR